MDDRNVYSEPQSPKDYKKLLLFLLIAVLPIVTFGIGYQLGSMGQADSTPETSQKIPLEKSVITQPTRQGITATSVPDSKEVTDATRYVIEGKRLSFAEKPSIIFMKDQDGSYDFFIFQTEDAKNKFTACMNKGVYGGVDYGYYGECNLYDIGVAVATDSLQSGETITSYIARTRNTNLSQELPKVKKIGAYEGYYYEEVGMGITGRYVILNNDTIYVISGNYFDAQVESLFEEVVGTINI
nr:hypothetical protein [Candidatus Woesebacteria bacterium]